MLTKAQRSEILRLANQMDGPKRIGAYARLADYLDKITVPEGWQVVPVEPTKAILDVLYDNGIDEHDEYLRNVYRAMPAAAPKPGDGNE